MHDIAIAQHILFSFETQPPGLPGALFALVLNKIIIRNSLSTDKAALKNAFSNELEKLDTEIARLTSVPAKKEDVEEDDEYDEFDEYDDD